MVVEQSVDLKAWTPKVTSADNIVTFEVSVNQAQFLRARK
jgi:hypothetical protein